MWVYVTKETGYCNRLINMVINYYGDYGDLACEATNQQEIIFTFYKIEFIWSIVLFISRVLRKSSFVGQLIMWENALKTRFGNVSTGYAIKWASMRKSFMIKTNCICKWVQSYYGTIILYTMWAVLPVRNSVWNSAILRFTVGPFKEGTALKRNLLLYL